MGSALSSIDQSNYPGPPIATQLNSDWTLAPLLFGWAVNCFLCGIVLSWGAIFRSQSRHGGDTIRVKIAVAVAVVFECLTAGVNLISIIEHGKSQDRDNDEISRMFAVDAISPAFGAVVAASAQFFFAARCHALLPSKYRIVFVCCISPFIFTGFLGALGTTLVEYINHGNTDVTRGADPWAYWTLYWLAMVWLWSNVSCDIIISSLLCVSLWTSRAEISVADVGEGSHADQLINSLMRLSLETAVLTSLTAFTAAICYVTTTTTTNLSYAFSNILPGLYALSLLWALNARHRIQREIGMQPFSEQVQVVWTLAGPRAAVDDIHGDMVGRIAVRTGEGLNVRLRRTTAPAKAASQLGCSVRMLEVVSLQQEEEQIGTGKEDEISDPETAVGEGTEPPVFRDVEKGLGR